MLKQLLVAAAAVLCLGEKFYVPMPRCDAVPEGQLGGKCERPNCFVPISNGRESLLYTCDSESDGTGVKGYVYYQVPPHVKVWESQFRTTEGKFMDTGADPNVRTLANSGSGPGGVDALGVDSSTVTEVSSASQWTRDFYEPAEVEHLGQSEKIRFKVRENSGCEKVGANIRFLDYRGRALVEMNFNDKVSAPSGNWELHLNGQSIAPASDSVWYDVEFDVDWVAKNLTNVLMDNSAGSSDPTLVAYHIPFANLGATPPVRKIELFNYDACNSHWGDMVIYSKQVPLWTPME